MQMMQMNKGKKYIIGTCTNTSPKVHGRILVTKNAAKISEHWQPTVVVTAWSITAKAEANLDIRESIIHICMVNSNLVVSDHLESFQKQVRNFLKCRSFENKSINPSRLTSLLSHWQHQHFEESWMAKACQYRSKRIESSFARQDLDTPQASRHLTLH